MSNSSRTTTGFYAFINFENLEQVKDKETRSQVATHVGRFHRNRSRPSKTKTTQPNYIAYTPAEHEHIPTNQAHPKLDKVFNEAIYKATLVSRFRVFPMVRPKKPHSKPSRLSMSPSAESQPTQTNNCRKARTFGVSSPLPKTSPMVYIAARDYEERVEDRNIQEQDPTVVIQERLDGRVVLNNMIDQSRRNPFATYPVNDSQDLMPKLVDYAIHRFWSSLSPDKQYGPTNPANCVYLAHMQSSPLAYYGYAMVLTANLDFLCDSNPLKNQYELLRAKHIHEATRSLRKTIAAMPTNPSEMDVSDELLGTVSVLASSSVIHVVNQNSLPESKFKSPLAAFQSINMWGTFAYEESHFQALMRMVKIRGGLAKVGSTYLAQAIQLTDLLFSSRKLCKTVLEWRNIMSLLPDLSWPYNIQSESCCSNKLASGFCYLSPSVLFKDNLGFVISAVAHTTTILDAYYQSGRPNSSIVDLVESRNRAQYSVLNLEVAGARQSICDRKDCSKVQYDKCVSEENIASHLFEIIRLTLLIYNNIVIFPIPRVYDVSNGLAANLKLVLSSFFDMDGLGNSRHSALLLWSLMVGGISTYIDSDREWYQDWFLSFRNPLPDLEEWSSVESLMNKFIWINFILEEEAFKFWSEAVYKNPDIK